VFKKGISLALAMSAYKPFVSKTADELVFGYDDTLVALAHQFYPRDKRPLAKMGLLNGVSILIENFLLFAQLVVHIASIKLHHCTFREKIHSEKLE
jgi:hypothetical protein